MAVWIPTLPMSDNSPTLPRGTWILLCILTLGWGMNWPMIKMAIADIPVWTFRTLCVAAGAIGMFTIAWFARLPIKIRAAQFAPLVLLAFCNVTIWNVLAAYGASLLPAGRSALLAYLMPLWTVLLSAPLLGERLTRRRVTGALLGMAGLGLLLGNDLVSIRHSTTGAGLMIGASFSWALGTVLMKRFALDLPPVTLTAWNMLLGGVPLAIGALALDPPHWRPIGTGAWIGLIYNMVIAFVLCYWAWFRILTLAPAGISALGTLAIPVVAVFGGMFILGERPGFADFVALASILAALGTVMLPSRFTLRSA